MVNEVLCKILCHNLCCLIQEQEELGIARIFWADEPAVKTLPAPQVKPVVVVVAKELESVEFVAIDDDFRLSD